MENWFSSMGIHGTSTRVDSRTFSSVLSLFSFGLDEDCLENSLAWSEEPTSGLVCYMFSPPSASVHGPWQQLRVTMMIEEAIANPSGNNDLNIHLFFLRPGSRFSVQEHRIKANIGPGYHNIGLDLFQYKDVSGKTDCIEEHEKGVLLNNPEYTFALCVDECLQKKEALACGCNSLRYAIEDDVRNCGVVDMVICEFDSGVALGVSTLNF